MFSGGARGRVGGALDDSDRGNGRDGSIDASAECDTWLIVMCCVSCCTERREGQQPRRGINYKWGYLIKNKSTERWLKFASFRRVGRGVQNPSRLGTLTRALLKASVLISHCS